MELDPAIRRRAEGMLGGPISSWDARTAGLTHAVAGIAGLRDGRSVFVKAAREELSAREVGFELRVLRTVEASFMPQLLAWDDADPPMFALEDLSHGHWPEPYPDDLSLLEAALAELRSLAPPPELELSPIRVESSERVEAVVPSARSGAPPLADWIADHEAAIRTAVAGIEPGDVLVHGDLWYSNICFLPDRVVFVDWSHVRSGGPWHDTATVSIDLILESRAPLRVGDGAGWAAAYLAASVGVLADGPSPSISDPSRWRLDVEELVDGAAWWLADEMDLPEPPRLSAREPGPR